MGVTYTNRVMEQCCLLGLWSYDGTQSEHTVDLSIVVVIILKQNDLMLHVLS
jgi:hypothetical protein